MRGVGSELRHVAVGGDDEADVPLSCRPRHDDHRAVDDLEQIEGLAGQGEVASGDPRQVEHSVDHGKQVTARCVDGADPASLRAGEVVSARLLQ